MSKTRPVDTSIHAVSPVSIFSAAASFAFWSAGVGGLSAAKRRPLAKPSRAVASKARSERFKGIPSRQHRMPARTEMEERDHDRLSGSSEQLLCHGCLTQIVCTKCLWHKG